MKPIFPLVVILFFFTACPAQVFKAGAVLGASAAQVEGDGYSGYRKAGGILGAYTNLYMTPNWSAQFEIHYIRKGSRKIANPSKGDFSAFNLNLDYIEIPIMVRRHYKMFALELGIYYGRLFNFKMEDQFGPIPVAFFPFKNNAFGSFLGVNYKLNDHFSVNIRSKNSILPIRDFENKDQNIGLLNKLFNRGWYSLDLNFSVRYEFN